MAQQPITTSPVFDPTRRITPIEMSKPGRSIERALERTRTYHDGLPSRAFIRPS